MRHFGLAALSIVLAAAGTASAAETATATIRQTGTTGPDFDYSIVVKDTGTTNIGTFWYSWVPGKDFMKTSPITPISSPTGWNGVVTNGGSSDGYAIQWIASSNPITPGNSLTFSYVSPDDFATTLGNSPKYPSTPSGTSFIYSAGPFSDGGEEFVVAAPEPGCVGLMAMASTLMLRRRRKA